jgi:hypothetical protein
VNVDVNVSKIVTKMWGRGVVRVNSTTAEITVQVGSFRPDSGQLLGSF